MKKIFSLLFALIVLFVSVSCSKPREAEEAAAEPTPTAAETEAPESTRRPIPTEAQAAFTPAPSSLETPVPVQSLTLLERPRESIVFGHASDSLNLTVYIGNDGNMYAIDGGSSGIFAEGARLLDADVKKAQLIYYWSEGPVGGYSECLLYLKNDGRLFFLGTDSKCVFCAQSRAETPVTLLEDVVNIGADNVSLAAVTRDGRLFGWDTRHPRAGGEPTLITEHADSDHLCGTGVYMTEDGEVFADNSEETSAMRCYVSVAKNALAFDGCRDVFAVIDSDFQLSVCRFKKMGFDRKVIAGFVVSFDVGVVPGFRSLVFVDAFGRSFFVSNPAAPGAVVPTTLMHDIVSAGSQLSIPWALGRDGKLYLFQPYVYPDSPDINMIPIADGAVFAFVGFDPETCIYETAEGRLFRFRLGLLSDGSDGTTEEIPLPQHE